MIGPILQYGAFGICLGASVILWYAVVRDDYAEYGTSLLGLAALVSGLALFYLINQFAVTDYTNGYVWNHTADYLSLIYRISGTYAGVNGSLLLWATILGLIGYWAVRGGLESDSQKRIGAIVATVLTVFFAYAITRSPFIPLTIADTGVTFGPKGLNPLLKNPYMIIHPPATFAGYALTLVPFAIGTAHFWSELQGKGGIFDERAVSVARWLRLSWWFLTASVALGALWSYSTLGWGGLWAWDPVETAVLVTWLFVTASLHVVSDYRSRARYRLLAPALSTLSFPSAIFARLMTQSGTSELHSFASGSQLFLAVILVFTTLVGVLPPILLWLRRQGSATTKSETTLSHTLLLSLGVLSLGLLTFVSLWGLVLPVLQDFLGGANVGVSVTFYNMWSYPFVIFALLTIGLYNDYDLQGNSSLRLLGVVVLFTVIVGVVPLAGWQFDPEQTASFYGLIGSLNALSLLPPSAYAIGATVTRLGVRIPSLSNRDRKFTLAGVGIVHIAIALLILTVPFTYMMATAGSGLVPGIATGHEGGVTLGESEYKVTVQNFTTNHVHSELTLTEHERDILAERIHDRGYRAKELPASASGNQIVYGEISNVRMVAGTGLAQLDNSSVWVDIGPIRENISLAGIPLYAQGTVNRSMGEMTVVRTDGMFLGTEPTGAIVPDNRATKREISVSVSRGDRTLAQGTTSVDYHFAYGAVGRPFIEHGILSETYVAAETVQYTSGMPVVTLLVKQVPLMNVVRGGIVLLLFGGALIVMADPARDTKSNQKKPK